MSPRIVHLLSGRDRRHYVRELRLAEQAHRALPARVEEAYRAAHRLACEEWSVRQFIGRPPRPPPRAPPPPSPSGGVWQARQTPKLPSRHTIGAVKIFVPRSYSSTSNT